MVKPVSVKVRSLHFWVTQIIPREAVDLTNIVLQLSSPEYNVQDITARYVTRRRQGSVLMMSEILSPDYCLGCAFVTRDT